jgi:eukaryotic-like serine/threonine-protein kinase
MAGAATPRLGNLPVVTRVVAGRFTLIDRIGAGGTGSVWRAYDHRERRYCAAKLISDPGTLPRTVREQAVRLRHPHLVTPYTWVADDDGALLAMDLAGGGSLATLISDYGALPYRYATEIIAQLLSALEHVHAAGVVHRDIKPSNVLLTASGTGPPHARLADFGIALVKGQVRLTSAGVVLGTAGYVAPEVLQGAEPGPRQDIYAVGRVARELLTGGTDDPITDEAAPPAAPPDVPSAVWDAVMAMSAADPSQRPVDARSAAVRLAMALGGASLELPARTPSGEPVEVFDQLGPPPTGWGPGGPTTAPGLAPGTEPA